MNYLNYTAKKIAEICDGKLIKDNNKYYIINLKYYKI